MCISKLERDLWPQLKKNSFLEVIELKVFILEKMEHVPERYSHRAEIRTKLVKTRSRQRNKLMYFDTIEINLGLSHINTHYSLLTRNWVLNLAGETF